MMAILRLIPCALRPAATASEAIAMGMSQPATLRTRRFRSSPQASVPPHTERAEMPRMNALGLASMTRSTAASSDLSMASSWRSKSASEVTGSSAMTMRAR